MSHVADLMSVIEQYGSFIKSLLQNKKIKKISRHKRSDYYITTYYTLQGKTN